jgi:hypothetical protein
MLPFDEAISPDLKLLDLKRTFDRLIIGPTQFADSIRHAFALALSDAGVADAGARVCASSIPIRT